MFAITTFSWHFGFGSFLINPLTHTLPIKYNWDSESQKFYIAMLSTTPAVGALIGSFAGKYFLSLGRLKALHLANAIIIIGSILSMTGNLVVMIIGRAFVGFSSIGLAYSIIVKIVREIAPQPYTGVCGTFNNLMSFAGFLLLMTLNFWSPETDDEKLNTHYDNFIFAIPIAISLF